MKQFIKILCFIILILFTCVNSNLVVTGAAEGLRVWYNNLVPVVLPFLLISGLFISTIDFDKISSSMSILVLAVCGILCGYPVGAITAGQLYKNNAISYKTACALLPLCNNISPMFLYGYIYSKFMTNIFPFYMVLLFIYVPQIIYALFYVFAFSISERIRTDKKCVNTHHKKPLHPNNINASTYNDNTKINNTTLSVNDKSDKNTSSISMILDNSIHTITIIGIYIVIFSIIDCVIANKIDGNVYGYIFSCFLEITKGTENLFNSNLIWNIKTALILSLTSFGGISAIFQSVHLLKESKLSFINYVSGKLICSTITFFSVYLVSRL